MKAMRKIIKTLKYGRKKMGIKIGEKYTFDSHGSDPNYNVYSGETVEVIRALEDDEYDLLNSDFGIMYKIKLSNGSIIDAFEDELSTN
ncbi:MAG: hypothetical protein PHY15_08545 [Eubacteriales bacterium]|nr:hypothetical protein [Eubacteriales bacterium]